MKIACVGSRDIDKDTENAIEKLGQLLVSNGHEILSGNANGTDQAFARGGNSVMAGRVNLYLPWASFEKEALNIANNIYYYPFASTAEEIAMQAHPVWSKLSHGSKKLMTRNAEIILNSDFIIAIKTNGKRYDGGTGHAIRIADALNKPSLIILNANADMIEPTHIINKISDIVNEKSR